MVVAQSFSRGRVIQAYEYFTVWLSGVRRGLQPFERTECICVEGMCVAEPAAALIDYDAPSSHHKTVSSGLRGEQAVLDSTQSARPQALLFRSHCWKSTAVWSLD